MTMLYRVVRLLAVLVALAVVPGVSVAQEAAEKEPFVFNPPISGIAGPAVTPSPAAEGGLVSTDALTMEATPELRRKLAEQAYAHQGWVFSHQQGVFTWQLWTSRISFGLVVAITVAGLYFSWLQFMAAHRSDGDHSATLASELELSGKGIKVSSPVLGVIILTISIGFFYLFVRHIYPIEAVRTVPESTMNHSATK